MQTSSSHQRGEAVEYPVSGVQADFLKKSDGGPGISLLGLASVSPSLREIDSRGVQHLAPRSVAPGRRPLRHSTQNAKTRRLNDSRAFSSEEKQGFRLARLESHLAILLQAHGSLIS